MRSQLFGLLVLIFSPAWVLAAETMFEGYYRIELAGKHIGYSIQRYSFDPKTGTFECLAFTRAKIGETVLQESLKAKADNKLHPISYQYTKQDGPELLSIDATFKGQVMKLKKSDGKTIKTPTYEIPEQTILSQFLVYLILRDPIQVNDSISYSGVAEEDGASYWGKAWLQSAEDKDGYRVFNIQNEFKGERFTAKVAAIPDNSPPEDKTAGNLSVKSRDADVSAKDLTKNDNVGSPRFKEANKKAGGIKYVRAEVISTDSATKKLMLELVASPQSATENHLVPTVTLKTIFGTIPTGKVNLIASPLTKPVNKLNPSSPLNKSPAEKGG
ncbi:MAG: hypothetical protein AB7G93_11935 [Bdellovibrionales bacterium]